MGKKTKRGRKCSTEEKSEFIHTRVLHWGYG